VLLKSFPTYGHVGIVQQSCLALAWWPVTIIHSRDFVSGKGALKLRWACDHLEYLVTLVRLNTCSCHPPRPSPQQGLLKSDQAGDGVESDDPSNRKFAGNEIATVDSRCVKMQVLYILKLDSFEVQTYKQQYETIHLLLQFSDRKVNRQVYRIINRPTSISDHREMSKTI
jgi:hypothetical protein